MSFCSAGRNSSLIALVILETRFIRFRAARLAKYPPALKESTNNMTQSRGPATVLCFVILMLAVSSLSLATTTPQARALTLYNSGNPTPSEQLVLEYINRARANPVAEGQRLGIDIHEGLQDDPQNSCYGPEYVGVRPPLAMNPQLLGIAEGHSQDLYNYAGYYATHSVHDSPDGTSAFQRFSNSGYNYISAGENVGGGGGLSATDLEDALMLDSEYPCRAHRMNLLDIFPNPPQYAEAGIGYYQGPDGGAYITQDFGTSVTAVPLLTGVVFNDADGNNFYDIGEGISGVTITPSAGNYYAVSSSAGGYAFPIPSSGTLTIIASGNGFGPISKTITLTGTNVEVDFTSQGEAISTTTQSSTQTIPQSTTQTASSSTTQTTTPAVTQTTSTTTTQSYQMATSTSSSTTVPPELELVAFQSSPSSFMSTTTPGTITACGNTYSYFQSSADCAMMFGATANLPTPSSGWMFDHWTWTGGVACSSNSANPANCDAYNSGGILIAVYAAQVNVLTNPNSTATVNWGSCAAQGASNGASFFSINFGSATVTACNIPVGYVFSSWNCSGGLSCQVSVNPTTVIFTGPGSITLSLQAEQTSTNSTFSSQTTLTSAVATTAYTSSPAGSTTTATSVETSLTTSIPMTLTPIPGFPWESILGGILLGLLAVSLMRKRRRWTPSGALGQRS